jgi:TfoX/Sxy family transcriptional regulator of competence genes
MGSSLDFVRYACAQMSGAAISAAKKMFGEFGVYCNGTFIGAVCDNQLFLKITPAGKRC